MNTAFNKYRYTPLKKTRYNLNTLSLELEQLETAVVSVERARQMWEREPLIDLVLKLGIGKVGIICF